MVLLLNLYPTFIHLQNISNLFLGITFNPFHPVPGQREKINLIFYFHTSLWYLERFYEGLTFCDTTKKCENTNLSKFLFYYSFLKCTGRAGLIEPDQIVS